MLEANAQQSTADELMHLPLFADESPEAIEWIARQMTVRSIEAGDVIVALGEAPVSGMDALHRIMTGEAIGTTTVTLLRRNNVLRLDITPVEAQAAVSAK